MLHLQTPGTSGAEIRRVAAKLRKAAAKDLTQELRRGQRQAFRPLQREIKAEALAALPKRGGYNRTMARTVKVTLLFGQGLRITAHVYARGKAEHRDVAAVNMGRLRHPLFGRRLHWFTTSVRPRFADRAVARVSDRVMAESGDALDRIIRDLARG